MSVLVRRAGRRHRQQCVAITTGKSEAHCRACENGVVNSSWAAVYRTATDHILARKWVVTVTFRDHSFPRPTEFSAKPWNLLFCRGNEPSRGIYAFPRNLPNFWKYTPKRMIFFSSLVPATRQKSNQYFIGHVFVHASWPLLMLSLVTCNILYFCL